MTRNILKLKLFNRGKYYDKTILFAEKKKKLSRTYQRWNNVCFTLVLRQSIADSRHSNLYNSRSFKVVRGQLRRSFSDCYNRGSCGYTRAEQYKQLHIE